MGHVGKFDSATLPGDGTVKVTGPFSLFPEQPVKPALIAFYLEQGATKIEGDGRWEPPATGWSGTGAAKTLTTGKAQATALAVLALDDPPGFMTVSWSGEVEVKAAD
jgi:hypothetical protein